MPPRTFNLHTGIQPDDPDALARALRREGRGNHGLRFERYFGQWSHQSRTELYKDAFNNYRPNWSAQRDPLQEWLQPDIIETRYAIGELECGDPDLIREYLARRAALVAERTGVLLFARLVAPLAIGLGNPHPLRNASMTWHFTLGAPYPPGSGLKQVARDCAETWSERTADDTEFRRIFGAAEVGSAKGSAGSVIVLDGLPAEPVTVTADITTSHYRPYYAEAPEIAEPRAPGDWFSPNPVTFPVVKEGALYHFALLPRQPAAAEAARDLRLATGWLMEGLEILGAGAKTGAAGLGRFAPAEPPAS
jgi:CRISPR-associated protein Cmr6